MSTDVAITPADAADAAAGTPDQGPEVTSGETQGTPSGIPGIPDVGHAKFYNKETGAYNWEAHSREQEYKAAQKRPADPASSFITPEATPEVAPADTKVLYGDFSAAVVSGDKATAQAHAQALIKAGVPAEALEQQVQAIRITQASQQQNVMSTISQEVFGAGVADKGSEAINHIKSWAQGNLSEADYKMYSEAVQGPSWQIAVKQLVSMAGKPGAINMDASGGGSADGTSFTTEQQMLDAIKDPRYNTDPVYRKSVEDRTRLMMSR